MIAKKCEKINLNFGFSQKLYKKEAKIQQPQCHLNTF